MKTMILLILTISLSVIAANAQPDPIKLPADVKPFVEKGSNAIALESADLNGDGTKDFILVLERENPTKMGEYGYPKDQRPMLVLIRGKNNKLTEAKRNEQIIMCSECGGMMGDPFENVEVGEKTFTVNHSGGSAFRWWVSYKFNYSRIDNTWQLVRFEDGSFHTVEPDSEKSRVLTPPKDFGKVDIADFDPADYEETGDSGDSGGSENSDGSKPIDLVAASFSGTAKGFIRNKDESVKYVVKADKGYRMKVSIVGVETPDEEGPVMIGYVTAPNGEEEGNPGGLFFDQVLMESGNYEIVVKQNLAKSGSANISFKVKVTLERVVE